MQLLKLSLWLPLILLGGVACVQKDGGSVSPCRTVCVDSAQLQPQLSLSTLFESPRAIVLREKGSDWMGSIDKMVATTEGLFVLDRGAAKGVFLFDLQGELVRRIGTLGRGPGEYLTPYDFTIAAPEHQVLILDKATQRVLRYDLATGAYLSALEINQEDHSRSYQIQYQSGTLFTDAYFDQGANQQELIRTVDLNTGKRKAAFLDRSQNKGWDNCFAINPSVFYAGDSVSSRFVQQFMDTVFCLSSRGVSAYLTLQGAQVATAEDIAALDRTGKNPMFFLPLLVKQKIFKIQNYIEKSPYIFLQYNEGTRLISLLYDLRTSKATRFQAIEDDLLFGSTDRPAWCLQLGCTTDEGMYAYTGQQITNLKQCAQNGVFAPQVQNIAQILQKSDDASPVIFYYPYRKKAFDRKAE